MQAFDTGKLIRKKSEGLLSQMFDLNTIRHVVGSELLAFRCKLPDALVDEVSIQELCTLYIYSVHNGGLRFKVRKDDDAYMEKFNRYIQDLRFGACSVTDSNAEIFKCLCFKFGFNEQITTADEVGYALASVAAYHRGSKAYTEPSQEVKHMFATHLNLTGDSVIAKFLTSALGGDLYLGVRELALFTDSIEVSIDWAVKHCDVSQLIHYYVIASYSKVNKRVPDKDLMSVYITNNVNDWRGQVEKDLAESYPEFSNIYAAAYKRAYKNQKGNFYDMCRDKLLAEKLYEVAGKPNISEWRPFAYPNDAQARIEQEIRNMFKSMGVDLETILPMGVDNCLLFYAFWIGRGYAYDKLVNRTMKRESYR